VVSADLPPEADLRERLAVLRRSARPLALFVVSAMVSALVLTYLFSEKYRASTTILYSANTDVRFEGLGQQQRTMGFPVPAVYPFETLGLTIKQVASSERILRPVVVDLELDKPLPNNHTGLAWLYHEAKDEVKELGHKAWQVLRFGRVFEEDRVGLAIAGLAKNVTVITPQKSYAATLTVVDSDPDRAARIVDRVGQELAKFLRDESAQSARAQGAELDQQLSAGRQEIKRARSAIEALKTSHHFISLNEETSLHLQTAEQFEQKLLTTESELTSARAKLKTLVAQREGIDPMPKAAETVADDPVYNRLRERRAELEVDLRGLTERMPRDHADVRAVQAKIRTTDELLAAAQATRVSQVSRELSKLYQTLHEDEVKTRAEIAGLEAAQQSLKSALNTARARITPADIETRHNDLQMRLAVLESDYKKLTTLREEVRAAEVTSRAEVQVLHAASAPDLPFRPVKIYHVLLAGLLALLVGVGFVYLLDYVRARLERAGAEEASA
jgi:uncharacterized protein involved in exopolysaccharide biosynthesis